MIEERSIYHNVDTINTFPTKKNICQWDVGFGFYGQPNPTCFDFFFFFPKSKFGNHHIFVIYHDISKTLDVLVHLLYKLSIPHKDRPFLHTPGLTRIVM
jgi:hypothetical protein